MTVAITFSSAELGIDAPLVTVEADASAGLPKTLIVGLAETAVRESKDRVKSAILSSGYEYPSKRITVNLAPADLPKSSGRYDLAIAVSILAASKQIPDDQLRHYEFLGELSLTGELRSVRGVLPAALQNKSADDRRLVIPQACEAEAALAESGHLYMASTLKQVITHLAGAGSLDQPEQQPEHGAETGLYTLSDVRGQAVAKRALVIAAAGGHNLLLVGPPGTGKTMLASRLPVLLPPMTTEEALEVASVASVSRQLFDHRNWRRRPFRTPHHTASAIAMVGGSSPPRPGEISLAHRGVLFLDEVPEYSRHVLEVLREPLESGEIWISRATEQVRYPADFQLVAAMNPCPCGNFCNDEVECECTAERIQRYRSRLSGPLLDRIDLHVDVPPLPPGTLGDQKSAKPDDGELAQQVEEARTVMLDRQGTTNSRLEGSALRQYCKLAEEDSQFLDESVSRLGISARGYFRILRVARTIADLSDQKRIQRPHLAEAIGYRNPDRRYQGLPRRK